MSRKSKTVIIERDGRDKGKQFELTEMSALATEKWAARFMFAVGKGVQIDDDIAQRGIAGVAELGLNVLSSINPADAMVLLDEMLACAQIVPDPKHPHVSHPIGDDDIDEIMTLATLRAEIFELHTGFSFADMVSKGKAMAAKPQGE